MEGVNLWLIMPAALMATASPGPSNMVIAATAIGEGRPRALALSAGILTGSLFWSTSAAMGLGAAMYAHVWVVETIRYLGAAYLLFLAYKSGRSALAASGAAAVPATAPAGSPARAYWKGLALHLTNPKAILFLGSIYAIGTPPGTPVRSLALVVALIGLQSATVFFGYALLFSSRRVARGYARLRRWFDGAFATFFAYAGIRILTAKT